MIFRWLLIVLQFIRRIIYMTPDEREKYDADKQKKRGEKERLAKEAHERRMKELAAAPKFDCENGRHDWGKWRTWGLTYQARNCKICNAQELVPGI